MFLSVKKSKIWLISGFSFRMVKYKFDFRFSTNVQIGKELVSFPALDASELEKLLAEKLA